MLFDGDSLALVGVCDKLTEEEGLDTESTNEARKYHAWSQLYTDNWRRI